MDGWMEGSGDGERSDGSSFGQVALVILILFVTVAAAVLMR
jgi:hypothetical protein